MKHEMIVEYPKKHRREIFRDGKTYITIKVISELEF